MPDVSLVSGSRQARAGRSRTNLVGKEGGQQVSSQDFARDVRAGGGARARAVAFEGLSRGLGSLVDPLRRSEQADHAVEMVDQKKRLQDQIDKDNAKIFADPEGSLNAVNTGTTSEFFGDGEFRSHDTVQRNLQVTAAKVVAAEARPDITQLIQETPVGSDPTSILNAWIEKQQEGMEPASAATFAEQARAVARPLLSQHSANLELAADTERSRLAIDDIVTTLQDPGSAPPTIETLQAMENQLAAVLPGDAATAAMNARPMRDNLVLAQVAAGNSQALALVDVPNKDGVTLRKREPQKVQAAEQASIAQSRRVKDQATQDLLESAEDRLLAIQAGVGGDDTFGDLFFDLASIDNDKGGDPLDSMRFRVLNAMLADAEENLSYEDFSERLRSASVTNKQTKAQQRKAWKDVMSGDPEVRTQAMTRLLEIGMNSEQSRANHTAIMSNNDLDPTFFSNLHGLYRSASPEIRKTFFPDDSPAEAVFMAMADEFDRGRDPDVVRDKFIASAQDGSPFLFLERQPLGETNDGTPKALGRGGIQPVLENTWETFREGNEAFAGAGEWNEQSPQVQEIIRRKVNMAAASLAGSGPLDISEGGAIVNRASDMLYRDFTLGVRKIGDEWRVQPTVGGFAPALTKGEDGVTREGRQFTRETAEIFRQDAEGFHSGLLQQATGQWIGAVGDSLTEKGGGGLIVVDTGLGPAPGYFAPGLNYPMPTSVLRDAEALAGVGEVIAVAGEESLFVPGLPENVNEEQRIPLEGGAFLLWSPDFEVWSLRWNETDARKAIGTRPTSGPDLTDQEILGDIMMVPDNIGPYGSAPIDEGPANMDELRRKHLEDRKREGESSVLPFRDRR